MALSEAQRATIRRLLGRPDAGIWRDTPLEDAMNDLSAQGQVEVEALLERIADAETQVDSVLSRGGIKRAEDIEFFQGGALGDAQSQLAYLLNQLASMFGVRPKAVTGVGPVSGHVRFA